MKNNIGRFAKGFSYPFRAGHFLLRHPKLYPFVLIPFIINLVVFSLAVWFGLDRFEGLLAWLTPETSEWWWPFVKYLFWIVAVLLIAVLVFFLFAIVGNLIASPFNDILSEKTEELLTGVSRNEPFKFRQFLRESIHTLFDELLKISAYLSGMVLLFLFLLLPAVGPVLYFILSLLWTALFLVVEYTGFIFTRHKLLFKDQRQFIRQRKLASIGFGAGALSLLAIPFLQFFTIPLGVIGAVHFWRDAQTAQFLETSDAD
jgi:CysZ protein